MNRALTTIIALALSTSALAHEADEPLPPLSLTQKSQVEGVGGALYHAGWAWPTSYPFICILLSDQNIWTAEIEDAVRHTLAHMTPSERRQYGNSVVHLAISTTYKVWGCRGWIKP